jgi:hypothetical protein
MEGKPVKEFPAGLDDTDVTYLMLYERYPGWTKDDIDNLPLAHWNYLPIVAAARAEIAKDAERRARG